jgi:hypothetical protein
MFSLQGQIDGTRWRWGREWQYVAVDVLAIAGLIAVIAAVAGV